MNNQISALDLLGIIVFVAMVVFSIIGVMSFKTTEAEKLIQECEKSLPRTQHCVLQAVPMEVSDETI